jgi:hypothetical protein
MIRYPEFRSRGWQIGSGPTEATGHGLGSVKLWLGSVKLCFLFSFGLIPVRLLFACRRLRRCQRLVHSPPQDFGQIVAQSRRRVQPRFEPARQVGHAVGS